MNPNAICEIRVGQFLIGRIQIELVGLINLNLDYKDKDYST